MRKSDKIYIAGHTGMVGSSILRLLQQQDFKYIIVRSSEELDLRNQKAVNDFFRAEKPEYVFLCAAKVGGILANSTYTAEFIYDNLMIANNVIHAAYMSKVKKLLNLGSSCIYPKDSPQPIKEEYLLTGKLEPTNEAYAIAKIAAIKLCDNYRNQYNCNFISAMPTNLYGPNDNYNLETSHVLPALIRKFHEAKKEGRTHVKLWGSGKPLREFLHTDDLAKACLFLMDTFDERGPINVGYGKEISIGKLAEMICQIVGYDGKIKFDLSTLDGTMRKLLDTTKIRTLGWKPKISLKNGILAVYRSLSDQSWY